MSMGSVKDAHAHWGTEGRIFSCILWMRKLKANSSDELPRVPQLKASSSDELPRVPQLKASSSDELPRVPQLLWRVAEVKVVDPTARLPRFVLPLLLSWVLLSWAIDLSMPLFLLCQMWILTDATSLSCHED